ncbi:MAG: hypothetical protein CM1200mP15_10460 [Dehalococcoidia bacterium]|nr:MAG: hypothetical protein CM1200mP15_10460 [Dehalococcoidia bacterium]
MQMKQGINKIYQADVPILADAKLALRDLIDAVKDRIGNEERGIKPEVSGEIKEAKDKWLFRMDASIH